MNNKKVANRLYPKEYFILWDFLYKKKPSETGRLCFYFDYL